MSLAKENTNLKKFKKIIGIIFVKWFKLLNIGLIIVIFIFGYLLIIRPKYKELSKITENLNNNENDKLIFSRKRKELEDIKDLLSVYNNYDSKISEKIKYSLPKKDIYEELFTHIDSLVSKNGLSLTSMSITRETEKKKEEEKKKEDIKNLKTISMDLDIVGVDYFSFKNILKELENDLKIIDIDNVSLSLKENAVSLKAHTYFLTE